MEVPPAEEYIFHEPVKNWITRADLPALLALADSQEPCASIALEKSPVKNTQGSTMGQEALTLIEGLRVGQYPPGPNSGGYSDARATELKAWAREQIAKGPVRD